MIEKYQKAASRQQSGLNFHNDAYLLFQFLGLSSFAKIQHKRYIEEKKTLDKIINHCLCNLDMLPKLEGEDSSILPKELYNTKASSVGNEYKRKTLANFMKKWQDWEEETEETYQDILSWCITNNQCDTHFFIKLIDDVCLERQFIHCLISKMSISNYDLIEAEHLADKML